MFRFELIRVPNAEPSGFDLGHVRIRIGDNVATSENRHPDQAFMIFITAADLLDHVASIARNEKQRFASVVCADSSLEINFRRRKKGKIEVGLGRQWLGTVSAESLLTTVFESVTNLLKAHPLATSDAARQDLEMALEEFRRPFSK